MLLSCLDDLSRSFLYVNNVEVSAGLLQAYMPGSVKRLLEINEVVELMALML